MSDEMTETTDAPRCAATTKRGRPCRTYARPGSTVCYEHDPALAEQRKAGKVRGGRSSRFTQQGRAQAGTAPVTEIQAELADAIERATEPAEVAVALNRVAGLVLRGQIPPRVGSVFAQLGNAALKGFQNDLRDDLARLEKVLDQNPTLAAAWKRRR